MVKVTMISPNGPEIQNLVILFDGVCNLCNGWVNFVIDRDPDGQFRFASLQSELVKGLTNEVSIPINSDTILLLDEGEVFQKSDAILRIVSRLNRGWPVLGLLRFVPRFLRDSAHRQTDGYAYYLHSTWHKLDEINH